MKVGTIIENLVGLMEKTGHVSGTQGSRLRSQGECNRGSPALRILVKGTISITVPNKPNFFFPLA
jgi:hypothetical protein